MNSLCFDFRFTKFLSHYNLVPQVVILGITLRRRSSDQWSVCVSLLAFYSTVEKQVGIMILHSRFRIQ